MVEKKKIDFEKMWSEAKEHFSQFSKEATVLLKKGEEEVTKFSGQAKINFENATLRLKKEQLFYLIGKESYKTLKNKKDVDARISSFVQQAKDIDRHIATNTKLLKKT